MPGLFSTGKLSPRKGSLVHEQVLRGEQQAVRWDTRTRREQHHVARYQFVHGNLGLAAIAQHRSFHGHCRQQLLNGPGGATFLPEAEQRTHSHNAQDDDPVRRVVQREGEECCGNQEKN